MTRHGSHTESRMRENCTYGSMRGRAYPARGALLYSTPHWCGETGGVNAMMYEVVATDPKNLRFS